MVAGAQRTGASLGAHPGVGSRDPALGSGAVGFRSRRLATTGGVDMSDTATIVFLHGIGGPTAPEALLGLVNDALRTQEYPAFEHGYDRVLAPDYLDLLRDDHVPEVEVPETWTEPGARPFADAKAAYLLRQEEMARALWGQANEPGGIHLGVVPDQPLAGWAAENVPLVRNYLHSRARRRAIWARVLTEIPQAGHVILIGHSLGSVVAVNLLKRLPPAVTVDMLLTLGSPLSIKPLRKISAFEWFPYDRVHRWVNVFDRRDIVTIGRGISPAFPALDQAVDTGSSHDLVAYVRHPVVAMALARSVYGSRPAESVGTDGTPTRVLDPAWHTLLASFVFSGQVAAACPTDQWRRAARLDAARRELAGRTLADIERRRKQAVAESQVDDDSSKHDAAAALGGTPVGDGRFPMAEDLLVHASSLVRDVWDDDALLPIAVGMFMSPVVAPFDIQVDSDLREVGLRRTFNRIRRRDGDLTDEEFARAVRAALDTARKALKDDSGFPLVPVLIGAGIAVLALTGVGLAVAAPAGLAGAAAITSTLAAFGPGGMVGGIVSLAALTGTGLALTGTGIGLELSPNDPGFRQFQLMAADRIANGTADDLRTTLVGLLAVVDAQARLQSDSTAGIIEQLLLDVQSTVQREHRLHRYLSSDNPVTEDWESKCTLVERALAWLSNRPTLPDVAVEGRRELLKEIEA